VTKHQLHELWTEIQCELRTLTPLFDCAPDGAAALEHFKEYISHNELGLALETLCEFLIESELSAISSEQIGQIQRLHSKMKMEDGCVENLRRKAPPGVYRKS
jgi:hypothetical protein